MQQEDTSFFSSFLYLFLHTSTSSPLFNQQYTHIYIDISSQLPRPVNIRKPLLRYTNVNLAMTKRHCYPLPYAKFCSCRH